MPQSSIQGAQKVINNFKVLPVKVQEDIKDLVTITTLRIHQDASNNAPNAGEMVATTWGQQRNDTQISQYIYQEIVNNGMTGVVGIEAHASKMAAYLEFGTGASAAGYVPSLPLKWQQIAMSYFVNGKGTLIRHPFLLPVFFRHSDDFVRGVRSIIRKAIK